MPQIPFEALPDDARLWIFPAEEPLPDEARRRVLERVDAFLDGWNAHGHPLTAGRDFREDRFLMVAVDERTAPPSGCSIDALLRELKDLEDELGVGLTDHGDVHYREQGGKVARASRIEFARRAREGEATPETAVFDATITRLGQLREGRFEVPAAEAWHRKAFFRDRSPG